MPENATAQTATEAEPVQRYDAIIIGAGINGMYQLIRLREAGLSVRVFEAGSDVGGTWYWNRYPGCRFDSESYTYIYSFSQELLEEWDWSEHFSSQPETLRYCKFVAEKFDLRKDIQFDTRIESAIFDAAHNEWEVRAEDGTLARARYLVTCLGPLSTPVMPNIPGVDSFEGESFHTGRWPHEPVSFEGKRVAVIGTGATAVQLIQEVAKRARHLTVFQRRPNWCSPLHNRPIDKAEMEAIRARYPDIFEKCRASEGGFMHVADPRKATEVDPEEREAFFEQLYNTPGFAIWMSNFYDTFTSQEANDLITDFIARKIRERVDDPEVAELLIPRDHGFGTRRVPMESGYYETYNRDNVTLVSIRDTPIERITPRGLRVDGKDYEFDMIIYATGFDAMLGSYNRLDIQGLDGKKLKEAWESEGPRTFLGVLLRDFPNMMMIIGPQSGSSFCNMPRCGEENADFITDLVRYTEDKGYTRIQPSAKAVQEWNDHVNQIAGKLLLNKTDSWFTGINRNIPGRDKRMVLLYAGGAPRYRRRVEEVVASDYADLEFA